jgi:hypothetical protein
MSAKVPADLVMRFWEVVSSCPQFIDTDEVRPKFDHGRPGHNAANQLYRRMERALTTLVDEMQQSAAPAPSPNSALLRQIDDLLSHGAAPAGRVRDVSTREPQFDVCAPGQEELAIAFVNEISQTARDRGATPDPIRLLEMAEALYRAEAEEWKRGPSPDVEDAASGRAALRRMIVGLEGVPDQEWLYRPLETDDWGWIRLAAEDSGPGPLVTTARSGEYDTKASLDEHRRAGTDPYGSVATHAVATQPRSVRQVVRLVEVLDREIERLTALDQEHARLESWIVLNTDYEPTDPAIDPTDRLERALDRLLLRAEAAP